MTKTNDELSAKDLAVRLRMTPKNFRQHLRDLAVEKRDTRYAFTEAEAEKIIKRLSPQQEREDCPPPDAHIVPGVDVTTDWFWEGNVVNSLAESLAGKGWIIQSKANTRTKEQGADILASRDGMSLIVEAKGYPSATYRDPRRAGERKSTNPTNQAEKWYSHALLKAVRLQTKYPEARIALGFPDFPRYQTLFGETRLGLEKLGVAVMFVNAAGEVREWHLD